MGKKEAHNHTGCVNARKYSLKPDILTRASRYNNNKMFEQTILSKNGFAHRLTVLRMTKGISAREMSLSMGMTANYINSIENGESMPSMSMFFEICEALNISPSEFFDYAEIPANQRAEIHKHVDKLGNEYLDLILLLLKALEK